MAFRGSATPTDNGNSHDPDKAHQSGEEDDENEFLSHVLPPFSLRPKAVLIHTQ
jgi:hypothetical protein